MEVFMNFINAMFGSILSLDPVSAVKMVVMWAIGGTLITASYDDSSPN